MFAHLPSELVLLVLSHCQSVRDLHNLIAASPRCCRVFASAPEYILLPLLRRLVPAAVWSDFAAVCQADAFGCVDSTADSVRLAKEDVPAFLDQYFDKGFDIPTSKTSLVAALRLHATISYFINDYTHNAADEISFLAEHGIHGAVSAIRPGRALRTRFGDSDSSEPTVCQSKDTDAAIFQTATATEITRLYRGFLRLELQSRVFRYGQHSFAMLSGREQFDLFLRRLPPWAVEEMTCVHHYFMYNVWDALEESVNCDKTDEMSPLRHFGIDLPFTMSCLQNSAWPLFISGLMLRGIEFLYDVLVTQKGNRLPGRQPEFNISTEGELRVGSVVPQFLASALEVARHDTRPITQSGASVADEDATRPSLGFCAHMQRARLADRHLPILQFQEHAAMRATGYVFWDADKIKSGVMENAVVGANTMEPGEYRDRYNREHKSLRNQAMQ